MIYNNKNSQTTVFIIQKEDFMDLLCLSIEKAWKTVMHKVENENQPLSSEKTLVFLFMWELKQLLPTVYFDFERPLYVSLQGSDKFLDLLVYSEESHKIALEFKLPKSTTKGGSNQTQIRENIYKDMFRLNYLVVHQIDQVKEAYFLCATNEKAYLNPGTYSKNPWFKTYHGHELASGFRPSDFESYPPLRTSARFNWEKVVQDELGKFSIEKKFTWLLIKI